MQSERLLLRRYTLNDAAEVQRLAGNWKIADTTLNIPHPYEDGMAEEWISTLEPKRLAGEREVFAITRVADGQLLGTISLRVNKAFERAELGYWIGEPFWGTGFCTEAAMMMIRYGFEELGLNRIHAFYVDRNPQSGRVLEKSGLSKEGVARQHVKKNGKYENLVLCGLLREDWIANNYLPDA